jgi:methylmalonyl-CoA/ethylmalonyl-CoA epimerase
MSDAVNQRLAHICILVRDIDQAINHYTNILGAVSPELLKRGIAKEERFAGKDRYVTAFFRAPGRGCDIQLLQPLDPESPLFKRLEKHGEGLHHIAFASSRLEDTFQELKKKGVSLHGDRFIFDADAPDTRWVWITPQYAHGVLVEVMDEYKPMAE